MASTEAERRRRQPILVPVDFSADATAALLWAARLARSWKAPLMVLHVVHDPGAAPGDDQGSRKHEKHLRPIEEAAEERMEGFLDDMRRRHGDELPDLEPSMVVGLPVTRILEVAAASEVQLIVMGSQGRTGLDRLLLGSKAEKVVRLAPMPVTIVKAESRLDGETGTDGAGRALLGPSSADKRSSPP